LPLLAFNLLCKFRFTLQYCCDAWLPVYSALCRRKKFTFAISSSDELLVYKAEKPKIWTFEVFKVFVKQTKNLGFYNPFLQPEHNANAVSSCEEL